MADADRELLDEVIAGAKVMAGLAKDEETFRAVVDAFRAQDGESMHALLVHHKLVDRCELVCHWLRSKEALLLCLELAGPPPVEQQPEPDPREFASVVVKLCADEEAVELLANAVQERDGAAWAELIERHKLQRFSHLLCHWVCTVHYRLVCDVVCRPIAVPRPHLIPELAAAGHALRDLVAKEALFAESVRAVRAGSCETLSRVLTDGGFSGRCHLICEWFCSWRCVFVCLRLCRVFPPVAIESQIGEMLEFARAGDQAAGQQGALERLAAATLREDADQVQSLAKELHFERFCLQFCHWVCFLRCQLFCRCVCPPRSVGVFTKIGTLYYDTDVHSHVGGSGLERSDQRAFYSTLRLNGGLSLVDGAPLVEYRFQTVETSATGTPTGSWQAVTAGQIAPTNIGSFIRFVPSPPFIEVIPVWVNNPASGVFDITPDAGGWIKVPPLTPVAPMVPGSGWRFVPGSDLITFDTTSLAPSVVSVDEAGVDAGDAPLAPLQTDVHYGVRMRLRDQGASGDGTDAGTCSHIAINNTRYKGVVHHPYWPGGLFTNPTATNEIAVSSLGIAELSTKPCSLLTNSLTVLFTAAHANLGDVSISMEGPGGPYAFDLSPASAQVAGEDWHGNATPNGWTFASLDPCAYLLKLSVTPLLTTGDADQSPLVDYIAFCKG
jgi:hypothetical protein